jgi:hypothetical protein
MRAVTMSLILGVAILERALLEFGFHSGKSFYPVNFRWNHKSNCGDAIQLPTNAALVCAVS